MISRFVCRGGSRNLVKWEKLKGWIWMKRDYRVQGLDPKGGRSTVKNHILLERICFYQLLSRSCVLCFIYYIIQVSDVVKKIPLSNSTVQRRINKMAQNVEIQLRDILKSSQLSLLPDESILLENESLLLINVRFIKEEKN